VIVEAGAVADVEAALDLEDGHLTGTAREVEEDCATPLCL
jgi:hypothetical protein